MRKRYDFSEAAKTPYAPQLKKQIIIRIDEETIDYFKGVSEEVGIAYQNLISDTCVTAQRRSGNLGLTESNSAAT